MTEDFRSQIKDAVKYFIWMCVLTLIIGIAITLILMPHGVPASTAMAHPAPSIASAVGTVLPDATS
jgi:hypothetical protein